MTIHFFWILKCRLYFLYISNLFGFYIFSSFVIYIFTSFVFYIFLSFVFYIFTSFGFYIFTSFEFYIFTSFAFLSFCILYRVSSVSGPWPIISTIAVILRLEHSRPKVLKIVNLVNNMHYNLQFNKAYCIAIN